MFFYLIVALILIAVVVGYFFTREQPRSPFVTEIANLSSKDRALVLVKATVWRLKWEQEGVSDIFLSPWKHSQEDCEAIFSELFELAATMSKSLAAINKRAKEIGMKEIPLELDIHAVRTWGVTLGGRLGKIKLDEIVSLWKTLHEAHTSIHEAIQELKELQQVHVALGHTGPFLEGFADESVIQEANRVPQLLAQS